MRHEGILLALCAVLLLPGCGGKKSTPETNVLLITMDTTRPDKLGAYGCTEVRTPAVDRLAREGVLFTHAYTCVPLTLPSHTSLMTGLYPLGHGVRNNGNYAVPEDITTLAEILSGAGYTTAAFVGAFVLDSQFGLSQGFDTYDARFGHTEKDESGYFGFEEREGGETTDLACSWLDSTNRPFFLWLHYFDPHYPYEPPAPFDSLYANPYLGEIAYTDSCIGRVIRTLHARDLLDRTLIILASDHGESLGEHGEMSHGIFLYDATTRVALIMRYPGTLAAGSRIDCPVSLVDVVPTICRLLSIDAPREVQGRNLLPCIEGRTGDEVPLYMETVYPRENYGWSDITGVLSGEWKYFRVTDPELYNLRSDPGELDNVIGDSTRVAGRMSALLDSLQESLTTRFAKAAASELDEETRARLESLGYMWGSAGTETTGADPKQMVQVVNQIDYGLLLFSRGNFEGAEQLFSRILEMDPNNLTAHNMLAISLIRLGRENEALYHWRKVIELRPNAIDARRNIAKVLMGRRLYDEAREQYETVLDLNPNDVKALTQLGVIAVETGETEKARGYLQEALKIDPDALQAYLTLGNLYREHNQLGEARACFEKAVALDSSNIELREDLGKVLRKLGKGDEAVEQLAWVARKRNDAASYISLAITLDREGRLEEAVRNFQRAIALDSLSFNAYNNMGISLMTMDRYAAAESSFTKALSLKKNEAEPYYNLGNLYAKMGKPEEAARSYRRFLGLWKGSDEVRQRALSALKSLEGE